MDSDKRGTQVERLEVVDTTASQTGLRFCIFHGLTSGKGNMANIDKFVEFVKSRDMPEDLSCANYNFERPPALCSTPS